MINFFNVLYLRVSMILLTFKLFFVLVRSEGNIYDSSGKLNVVRKVVNGEYKKDIMIFFEKGDEIKAWVANIKWVQDKWVQDVPVG